MPLVPDIRTGLRAIAEPERAPRMQAYMKSAMPYLGVRVPQVRAIVREQVRRTPPMCWRQLGEAASVLWREATHREERYAATALTGLPPAVGRLELLALHEEMIVTGAWWDHVDELAHRIGATLRVHPDPTGPVRPMVLRWCRSPDRWLRRTSIICQLGAKTATDVPLLAEVIRANAEDREFFVRKAIGWALRDYARTDPGWVRHFVADHPVSPLSRREALKHLPPFA
ncbi:MAG: DNA alkylation repair protein [Angustibacter sp.]